MSAGVGGKARPNLSIVGKEWDKEGIELQLRNPKTRNPKSIMLSYSKLLEKDIDDLARYLAGLPKPKSFCRMTEWT